MGLSGPDENAVVLRRRDGLAETRCCHRSWPLWARNGHAKPGFQEPLTLILGQAPRSLSEKAPVESSIVAIGQMTDDNASSL
jgi:hypothetical protein